MRTQNFLAAASLSVSLMLFGCTTNQNPGNGEPARGPAVGPTSPSSTPGSSSGTPVVPPPMISASRPAPLLMPDEAAATMALLAGHRGVELGPVNPGPSTMTYAAGTNTNAPAGAYQTGQDLSNSMRTGISAGTPRPIRITTAADGRVIVTNLR